MKKKNILILSGFALTILLHTQCTSFPFFRNGYSQIKAPESRVIVYIQPSKPITKDLNPDNIALFDNMLVYAFRKHGLQSFIFDESAPPPEANEQYVIKGSIGRVNSEFFLDREQETIIIIDYFKKEDNTEKLVGSIRYSYLTGSEKPVSHYLKSSERIADSIRRSIESGRN